jgi:hypothetical protein
MATTFKDLYEDVLKRGHLSVSDAVALPLVKDWINQRYRQVARMRPWRWLLKRGAITLVEPYADGTVTVSKGSATITGSGTDWGSQMVGQRFKVDGFDEVYKIASVASKTSLTLETPYQGSTGSGKSYRILYPEYSLASDFDRLLDPHRSFSPYQLVPVGLMEMNRRWGYHGAEGRPTHYTLAPQNGSLKLLVYPAPDSAGTLYYDYIQAITELSNDSDEPLIPENYRHILADGAYADLLTFKDDNRSSVWEARFQRGLLDMAGDYALTDDVPRLRPVDWWRSHYRTARRGRVDDPWGFDHGIDRR